MTSQQEAPKMVIQMPLYMCPELKDLLRERAKAEGMSETGWAVTAIAEKMGRPDLAYIPRKKKSDRSNGHAPKPARKKAGAA